MRAWLASDLHLEFEAMANGFAPPVADVMICAGDILTGGVIPTIRWLAQHVSQAMPVVFVAGNHEFYGASFTESLEMARKETALYPNIHFLENDSVTINGTTIAGGTLWTDFRLLGAPELAMAEAGKGMSDYRRIKFSKQPYQAFRPIHTFRRHQETRSFLERELDRAAGDKTVVVTHHAPSRRSVSHEFENDALSACYASDMDEMISRKGPAVWVHGHVHHACDYTIGSTRIICNPRGYPGEAAFGSFDPGMVIEI